MKSFSDVVKENAEYQIADGEVYLISQYDKVENRYNTIMTDASVRNAMRAFLRFFDGNNRLKYVPGLVGYDIMNISEYELRVIGAFSASTGRIRTFEPAVLDLAEVLTKPADTHGAAVSD